MLRNSARLFSTSSKDETLPADFDFVLPTYDKAFKELLHDTEARNSLFRGFVDGTIQSSEILGLSNKSLKDKDQVTMDSLGAFLSRYKPIMDEYLTNHPSTKSKKAPVLSANTLMHDLATRYYDPLCSLFPVADKESYMDFRCSLKDGSTVLVEMQVRTEPYWNSRALAYAARIYSSQLVRGESWGKLKKVYALNILGGYDLSREGNVRYTWAKHAGDDHDGKSPVLKRYQLVNLHNSEDKIPDLELIQIFPQLFLSDSTKLKELGLGDDQVSLASEWLELFKAAQMKSKSYVDQVKDQGVKRAYSILGKKKLADNYKEWVQKYGPAYADNIVQEAAAAFERGKTETTSRAIRAMKKRGISSQEIADELGVAKSEVDDQDPQ
jgi:predicted transposase/invertase (TIGR01784 family)